LQARFSDQYQFSTLSSAGKYLKDCDRKTVGEAGLQAYATIYLINECAAPLPGGMKNNDDDY